MGVTWALTADLARPVVWLAFALGGASLLLLTLELARRGRRGVVVALSGVLSTILLVASVLRPATIRARGHQVGPRVLVLLDRSRSLDLPGEGGTRRAAEAAALDRIRSSAGAARLRVFGFGDGPLVPWDPKDASSAAKPALHSDLGAGLASLATLAEERPSAIVIVSDGRLDRPSEHAPGALVREWLGGLDVPVHTVGLAERAPADASIRAVHAAGAAVAHQPLPLTLSIGCEGGLACGDIPVQARELLDGAPPVVLASGTAHVQNGTATVELSITLERAGARIVEVSIEAPLGDEIADNDRRLLVFNVSRDRVRVLHVAGRPTYDVRALRTWLKSNASIDVVAFFILRTHSDNVNASEEDLALIPFPVHELFSEHLPSFDAVVLQDFNAAPYELLQHLPALARYVEHGGGLIMVGGPDSFGGGHYAGTRLADVLPVELGAKAGEAPYDLGAFVPAYTEVARAVPVFRPLRGLLGDTLPELEGANRVGDARPGSYVLLEHPRLRTPSGAPMPLLALGEKGDGRAIALALDSTYRLAYSRTAAEMGGRAHGALWDGLLGWLMRDPRYEPAQVELVRPCIAGEPLSLAVQPLPGSQGTLEFEVRRLDQPEAAIRKLVDAGASSGEPLSVDVGALEPGGYSARVRVGQGPATRRDFACERGGDEWADSRPDNERLRAIARETGGEFVGARDAGSIPLPAATEVSAERHVTPLAPPWLWTVLAAAMLGAHWIVRRRSGFA